MDKRTKPLVLRTGNRVMTAIVVISLSMAPLAVAESNENVPVIKESKKQEFGVSTKKTEDAEVAVDNGKEKGEAQPEGAEAVTESTPPEGESQDDEPFFDAKKKKMLVVGAGVTGAAALALAIGSSSGGGSSAPPPPPAEPYNGPDISGAWSGEINLVYYGREAVSATITQRGKQVQIRTTSTMPYGHYFVGTIDDNGAMLVYDQETGEDWSTFEGNATSQSVRLYDWVIEVGKLDKLKLHR